MPGNDVYWGCNCELSVATALDKLAESIQAMGCNLLFCRLDSSDETFEVFQHLGIALSMDVQDAQGRAFVAGSSLQQLIHWPGLFTHFDQVAVMRSGYSPISSLLADAVCVSLTYDSDEFKADPTAAINAVRQSDALCMMGDGDGLNFVSAIKDWYDRLLLD